MILCPTETINGLGCHPDCRSVDNNTECVASFEWDLRFECLTHDSRLCCTMSTNTAHDPLRLDIHLSSPDLFLFLRGVLGAQPLTPGA